MDEMMEQVRKKMDKKIKFMKHRYEYRKEKVLKSDLEEWQKRNELVLLGKKFKPKIWKLEWLWDKAEASCFYCGRGLGTYWGHVCDKCVDRDSGQTVFDYPSEKITNVSKSRTTSHSQNQ